jgi:hypothetical protein
LVGAALALGGPAAERAEVLAATGANLPFFLDRGIPADGYCDGGVGYWNYGIGHAALLAKTVAQATGGHLRLFAGEKARRIAEFPANLEITPGVFPAFSDGAPDVKHSAICRALTARLPDGETPFPTVPATRKHHDTDFATLARGIKPVHRRERRQPRAPSFPSLRSVKFNFLHPRAAAAVSSS